MQVIKLHCNHCFTPVAIKKWLKEVKAECPVCRYSLDSKEIETEETAISTLENQINLDYSLRQTQVPLILNTILISQSTLYPSAQPIDNQPVRFNHPTSSDYIPLEPPAIRRRITFNNVMSNILNNQQEEDLQHAILNSLTNTT